MSRVPPSRPPQAPPAPARIIRPKAPKQVEKQIKLKAGNTAGDHEAEAGHEVPKLGEGVKDPQEHAKLAENWAPESHAEKAEEKKEKDELHAEAERAEGGGPGGDSTKAKGFLKQIKPALKPPMPQKKPVKDGFERPAVPSRPSGPSGPEKAQAAQKTDGSAALAAAAKVQSAATAPPAPRPSRPPDAFSVLHAAQEPGVFFKADGHHGAAEQANPELEEAIEEAIRLLFGVRGILRVTGGFNQANEAAIIIVATQGFGEASMKLVPPKVHRFETILALPYDMLPLKRERL